MKKMSGVNSYYKKLFWQIIFINTASALAAVVFTAANEGLRTAFSTENLITTYIYANCIGTLVCLIILFLNKIWQTKFAVLRLAKTSVAIFVATFLGVTLARLILAVIFPNFAEQGIIPTWQNFVFSLGLGFTFGFSFYFYEILQSKLRQKELDAEKARALAAQAQLASLESRIHPHFLFNTLNSIAALIQENPFEAEKMVEKLSALLRYSLDARANGTVSLAEELEITRKYLEIEKARFGERLDYRIELDGDADKIKVPVMSLQTLVENSIKHAASKTSRQTGILISAYPNESSFIIEVTDTGDGFSAAQIEDGHGLDNLGKRLENIFGEKAGLEIVKNGAGGRALIKVPLSIE